MKLSFFLIFSCFILSVSCGRSKEEKPLVSEKKQEDKQFIAASSRHGEVKLSGEVQNSPQNVLKQKKSKSEFKIGDSDSRLAKTEIKPAKLEFVSYSISPSPVNVGEKSILNICVKNIAGRGRELSVKVKSPILMPSIEEFSIWPVETGESKCFDIQFFTPSKTSQSSHLELYFSDGLKKIINVPVKTEGITGKEKRVLKEKDRIKKKMEDAVEELDGN